MFQSKETCGGVLFCDIFSQYIFLTIFGVCVSQLQGRIQGGGEAHPARPTPKIGKNMIFLRKIMIFHTKYPKIVRASLRSASFFLSPPLSWSPGSAPEL